MKELNLHDIRKAFLEFFEEKNHFVEKSFSLIPKNDKSLLLINAGMAPLKPYFLGTEEPPNNRMATCQKCIRTGDIDNVGKTDRHGTFFEMLGNFSFGDYFKTEAIQWAWEFMTERLNVPEEKLWVSVFYEDDEAYNIWKDNIKIKEEKIVKLGKEDNFWEHGLGPCGPCSEIYIDRGEKFGCGSEDCKPGCECDRFVEVWNLVFSQFDKDEKGNYNLLPNPNIDTGMGLERITVVLNNANNIFEIEPINSIIKGIESISKVKYKENYKEDVSIRVMTDHLRAMTFMIADGIIPSNEGRGYVLRRLIRRAYRHGKLIGIEGEFLYKLSNIVIENWAHVYEGLKEKQSQIEKIIKVEEQKFQETIDQGNNILEEYLKELKEENIKVLDGKKAFKLYDTYGFPLDLTKEILFEKGFEVSEEEFNKEMEEQRERARKARLDDNIDGWQLNDDNFDINYKTEFKGYDEVLLDTEVIHLIKKGELVNNLNEGEEGIIILKETPFYSESGGQIGDTGTLKYDDTEAIITNTTKGKNGTIFHNVKILKGKIVVEDKVSTKININRRKEIARNHTATHLLHRALKDIIGEHVNQSGSLVTDTRLRFDFTHFEGLTNDQIKEVENLVNLKIFESLDVKVVNKTLDEAKKLGATALFDEKYGDNVRVVSAGKYSTELCGGTHVENTSQIQIFKIISESGIASGVRRIEAVTGEQALKHINEMYENLEEMSILLKTNKNDINDKIKNILDDNKKLEKELESLKSKLANSKIDDILNDVLEIDGIKILAKKIDGLDMNGLRQMGDNLKDKLDSIVIVLATVTDEKVNFIATVTSDLIKKGIHSGNLIREIAKATGGSGGGRPDMAQAGGKDITKVEYALNLVKDIVLKQLS